MDRKRQKTEGESGDDSTPNGLTSPQTKDKDNAIRGLQQDLCYSIGHELPASIKSAVVASTSIDATMTPSGESIGATTDPSSESGESIGATANPLGGSAMAPASPTAVMEGAAPSPSTAARPASSADVCASVTAAGPTPAATPALSAPAIVATPPATPALSTERTAPAIATTPAAPAALSAERTAPATATTPAAVAFSAERTAPAKSGSAFTDTLGASGISASKPTGPTPPTTLQGQAAVAPSEVAAKVMAVGPSKPNDSLQGQAAVVPSEVAAKVMAVGPSKPNDSLQGQAAVAPSEVVAKVVAVGPSKPNDSLQGPAAVAPSEVVAKVVAIRASKPNDSLQGQAAVAPSEVVAKVVAVGPSKPNDSMQGQAAVAPREVVAKVVGAGPSTYPVQRLGLPPGFFDPPQSFRGDVPTTVRSSSDGRGWRRLEVKFDTATELEWMLYRKSGGVPPAGTLPRRPPDVRLSVAYAKTCDDGDTLEIHVSDESYLPIYCGSAPCGLHYVLHRPSAAGSEWAVHASCKCLPHRPLGLVGERPLITLLDRLVPRPQRPSDKQPSDKKSSGTTTTAASWQCPQCTVIVDKVLTVSVCPVCDYRPVPASAFEWLCDSCTFVNRSNALECDMCTSRRPWGGTLGGADDFDFLPSADFVPSDAPPGRPTERRAAIGPGLPPRPRDRPDRPPALIDDLAGWRVPNSEQGAAATAAASTAGAVPSSGDETKQARRARAPDVARGPGKEDGKTRAPDAGRGVAHAAIAGARGCLGAIGLAGGTDQKLGAEINHGLDATERTRGLGATDINRGLDATERTRDLGVSERTRGLGGAADTGHGEIAPGAGSVHASAVDNEWAVSRRGPELPPGARGAFAANRAPGCMNAGCTIWSPCPNCEY